MQHCRSIPYGICCTQYPPTLNLSRDPVINNEFRSEPFPFFHLPDVVIRKILKEYVPVSDKAGSLSQIEAFRPYLALQGVWHQPTLKLHRVVRDIEPGWYVDRNSIYNRYYLSVDYNSLTVTIYSFCTRLYCSGDLEHFEQVPLSLSNVQQSLQTFKNFQLTRIFENDILVYSYKREYFPNPVYFWIFVREKTVFWMTSCNEYPLKDNKCVIPEGVAFNDVSITLLLQSNWTVHLKCTNVNGKQYYNNLHIKLSPLTFEVCDKLPHPQGKCTCHFKNPNYIHAASTVTFSNFEDYPISMMIRHFVMEYFLVDYNVISMLRLKKDPTDELFYNEMWSAKFKHSISQICDLSTQFT